MLPKVGFGGEYGCIPGENYLKVKTIWSCTKRPGTLLKQRVPDMGGFFVLQGMNQLEKRQNLLCMLKQFWNIYIWGIL